MSDLGQLVKVDNIRSIWLDEARDFTPWLARPENLSQLSDAIGYGPDGLELLKMEENVGSFFADIVARDTLGGDSGLVLIENQFGKTNHDHLGKIITYSSGLANVRTIVWIAEVFREEHRAALDWLNRVTKQEVGFLGIEVELWRIGGSLPAPRFNIVARPNDWERSVVDQTALTDMSDLRKLYVRYWTALGERIRQRKGPLKPQKGLPQQWTNMSIGRANFALVAQATEASRSVRAELALTGTTGKLAFSRLSGFRPQIDEEYGAGLIWDEMPGKIQTRISETLTDVDIWDEKKWSEQHDWLASRLERLHRVFYERIRTLDLGEDPISTLVNQPDT